MRNLRQCLTAGITTLMLIAGGGFLAASPATAALPAATQPSPEAPADIFTPPARGANDKPLKGFHAPKGNLKLRPATTSKSLLAGPYYHYALARQILTSPQTSTGLAGNLTIEFPQVESGGHSLAELAVSDTSSGQNYVEVGWRKTSTGSSEIFVFLWINGVSQCYNGCGWVEYTANCSVAGQLCAGDSLSGITAGTSKRFQITYSGGAWWIGYDLTGTGGWMGYFPGTLWTGASPPVTTFNQGLMLSAFHEVVHSTKTNTCTDMGNGLLPSNGSAARIGSLAITGISPPATVQDFGPTDILPTTDPATVWDSLRLSATTMRAGGPGWNSAGTAAGSAGSC